MMEITVTFIHSPLSCHHHHRQHHHLQKQSPWSIPIPKNSKNQAIQTQPLRRRPRAYAVSIKACDNSVNTDANNENNKEYAPVEDGVELPSPTSEAQLRPEASWLEIELRSWLDDEWPDSNARKTHHEIAYKVSQIYFRLRTEGIHDIGTLLVGIGSNLEGSDLSKTYIGAWTVANKASDLLLRRFVPGRFQGETELSEAHKSTWSVLNDSHENKDIENEKGGGVEGRVRRAASPSLADKFERYRFLQMILDGDASKPLIDGAVAVAMGFEYKNEDGTWNGEYVTDTYFKQFGNTPPDVLGEENDSRWTKTLVYLDSQVKCGDHDGQKEEGLQVVIETLHGFEITKIQLNDENDHSFKKRVAVTKWLHLLGGF